MIPRAPGVPRYASVYPEYRCVPRHTEGGWSASLLYTGESLGYARYTCVVHGSMAENTHQLGQFEVHVAANVAKKARR